MNKSKKKYYAGYDYGYTVYEFDTELKAVEWLEGYSYMDGDMKRVLLSVEEVARRLGDDFDRLDRVCDEDGAWFLELDAEKMREIIKRLDKWQMLMSIPDLVVRFWGTRKSETLRNMSYDELLANNNIVEELFFELEEQGSFVKRAAWLI